jgi:formylglycine-generating enzyme required for sulfatase activity
MAGNVVECCWDWLGNYSTIYQTDVRGPESGSNRAQRGGQWNAYANRARVAIRYSYDGPAFENVSYGFRCARGP